MDKVSVIIPVYNKEQYIERSINSVLTQNYQNFELIIIDDGSKDQSRKKIDKIKEIDDRIKYFYKENGGVSSARNYGIEKANGTFISFLDADDTYEEDFLRSMITSIENYNISYSGNNFIDPEGKKIINVRNNFSEGDVLLEYLCGRITPHTNSWLIKKEFIIENGLQFLDGLSWGEDYLFFSKLLLHENQVVSVKKNLTNHYRDIPGSLSSLTLEKIQDDLIWMQELKKYISEISDKPAYLEKIFKIIDGYRIPGVIINRLNKAYHSTIDKKDILKYFYAYYDEVNGINFSNGLRSIKLFLQLGKLKRNILKIKKGSF